MKRFRLLLELPILCSLLTFALAIAGHTFSWVPKGRGNSVSGAVQFVFEPLTGIQMIQAHCTSCHRAGRSGIDFDDETLTLEAMRADPSTWQMVAERLRAREMPPRGFPQPTDDERARLLSWLEQEVLPERYNPAKARMMARRLHRSELLHSLGDLLRIKPILELALPVDQAWHRCDELPEASADADLYRAVVANALDQAMTAEGERELVDTRLFSTDGCMPPIESARENLTVFVRRAFRRAVEPTEVDSFVMLFEQAESAGNDFPSSMKRALAEVLNSPQFLYRVEWRNAGPKQPDDPFALASRLSYFLWRSTPDDPLLALAEQGLLAENLEAQVRRMLKDPRAKAFSLDFAESWLTLAKIEKAHDLDEKLRLAMRQETELFLAHILSEDRSALELLESDYTFLNERLAAHYGIENVRGDGMRRVELQGAQRGGLLGHASIAIATTPNAEVSPVNRGKWVSENLLGAAPIKPPPGLLQNPSMDPRLAKGGSQRKQMEFHRDNPSCSECHAQLDAIGLALDNYDVQGAWRRIHEQHTADSVNTLPDGTRLQGPVELKRYLLAHRDAFARGLRAKMLQFALGRKLADCDRAALEPSFGNPTSETYRLTQLIMDVATSAPFREGWRERPQ